MTQINSTSLTSSPVDIQSDEDLTELKSKSPKHSYRDLHFSFLCSECNTVHSLALKNIKSFPIICRGCRYRHRYDDPNYINKMKQTNLAKYGVEYNSQTSAWKDSVKKTSKEKYGVDHFTNAPEIRTKITNTTISRFGGIGFASDEIKDKQRATMVDRYNGYHNLVVPELKNKFFDSMVKCHGGIGYAVPEIFDKQKMTMIRLYGTDKYTHTMHYAETCKKKYLYNSIYFDSLNEIEYYIELVRRNASFEYHPKIRLEYEYNGNTHYYFPDFIVDGILVELKGKHFFCNKSTDQIDFNDPNVHMINPYNRKFDGLADAKYQCMKSHNVTIVIVSPIKNRKTFITDNGIIVKQHQSNNKQTTSSSS